MGERIYQIGLMVFILLIGFIFSASATWIDGSSLLHERTQQLLREGHWIESAPHQGSHLPSPKVGTVREFYAMDFTRHRSYIVKATCQAVGRFSYIFVEDTQWQGQKVTEEYVTKLLLAFEGQTPANSQRGIYQLETEVFGQPPDEIDSDPKIYVLVMDIRDDYDGEGYVAGYFDPLNQESGGVIFPLTGAQYYSNEVELLYLDCNPLDTGSEKAAGVLAHELQHLIHWQYDKEEEIWVNEGCSEYARVILCGYDDLPHVKAFEQNPDVSLINWSSKENIMLANYGAAFLFTLYLHEQYGSIDTIAALAQNPMHGIHSVDETLLARGYSAQFEDVFYDWQIANYLDNPSFQNGRYGYSNLDLKLEPGKQHISYPILNTSGEVNPWACDYIEFTKSEQGEQLELKIESSEPLRSSLIYLKRHNPVRLQLIPVDSQTGMAKWDVTRFGAEVDRLVLIPSFKPEKERQSRGADYSYSARVEASKPIVTFQHDIDEPHTLSIRIKMDTDASSDVPRINLKTQTDILAENQTMLSEEDRIYFYQIHIQPGWRHTKLSWEVMTSGQVVESGVVWVTSIQANTGGILNAENMMLEVPKNAIESDLPFTVVPIQADIAKPTDTELNPIGSAYFIGPSGLIFHRATKLTLRASSSSLAQFKPSRVGIYCWDGVDARWKYSSNTTTKQFGYIATIERSGIYSLQADTVRPKFDYLMTETRGETVFIQGRAIDFGSGINCDSLRIIVNGGKIPALFHQDEFAAQITLTSPSETYQVTIRIEDLAGNTAVVTRNLSIELSNEQAAGYHLGQNFPNPANPETWIPYRLKEGAEVTIRIYNSAGQLVRKLFLGYKAAGSYYTKAKAAHWDGRNDAGERVSSGVYFYVLSTGSFYAMKKLVIMR